MLTTLLAGMVVSMVVAYVRRTAAGDGDTFCLSSSASTILSTVTAVPI